MDANGITSHVQNGVCFIVLRERSSLVGLVYVCDSVYHGICAHIIIQIRRVKWNLRRETGTLYLANVRL